MRVNIRLISGIDIEFIESRVNPNPSSISADRGFPAISPQTVTSLPIDSVK